MIFSASLISFLLTGCTDEPEYDLSQIPVEEEPPTQDRPSPSRDVPPTPNEADTQSKAADLQPEGNRQDLANNTCVLPFGQTTVFTEKNSVTASISLDSKVLGEELMIDIIQSEHGERYYGVMCKGTELSFQIPNMLGSVRVAVFIDKDNNGPSKKDLQGVTNSFTVTDQPVIIPSIEWSTEPLRYYNFDSQENPPANPINDGLSGDIE